MDCVSIVPDSGGAGGILGFPELQSGEESEAVEKIIVLLQAP